MERASGGLLAYHMCCWLLVLVWLRAGARDRVVFFCASHDVALIFSISKFEIVKERRGFSQAGR